MNVTEVKLQNALERETKLKESLQKEKDRNKKLEDTLKIMLIYLLYKNSQRQRNDDY